MHAYKHFIHSGVGLRQVCDIGLWACHYEKEINWLLLREQCASVHADIYAEALFKIAQERLELRWELPKCWDYSKIDEEAMLEDMFVGGLHGASTMSRLHSSTVTSNAVETERSGTKKSILRIVFPSRKFMVGKYPFVSKYPFLLPAAWLGRLFGYVLETGKYRDNSVSEGLETAKNRLKLLKQYGILS